MIGVDFKYSDVKKNDINTAAISQARVKNELLDHFSKDYYRPGDMWIPPDMEEQRRAFLCSFNYLSSQGVEIFNASRETYLDCIPRIDLEDAIKGS